MGWMFAKSIANSTKIEIFCTQFANVSFLNCPSLELSGLPGW